MTGLQTVALNNLCQMLGQPELAAADSAGERYAFEKYVSRTRGGKGFADVWMLGRFAREYKGKHKNLQKAYEHLLDYREDLGNPLLLVVCDLDRFEVHTNFTSTSKRVTGCSPPPPPQSPPQPGPQATPPRSNSAAGSF